MYNGDLILAAVPVLGKSDLLKGDLQKTEHYRVVLSWTCFCSCLDHDLSAHLVLRMAKVPLAVDLHAACGLLWRWSSSQICEQYQMHWCIVRDYVSAPLEQLYCSIAHKGYNFSCCVVPVLQCHGQWDCSHL